MTGNPSGYPARLNVVYPETLSRLTTLLRPICAIPILFILAAVCGVATWTTVEGESASSIDDVTITDSLGVATTLMIVFRRRYPRWWFNFARELTRFGGRVIAYLCLLTDRYPSTEDEQSVHIDLDYPNAEADLNRWLPLVKWLLSIPHAIVLAVLWVLAIPVLFGAWIAILVTGTYPRPLFDYVVGVFRWSLRVSAYAVLLVTDRYPPFSLR